MKIKTKTKRHDNYQQVILGCAPVGTPDIRPPPQTISYTSWLCTCVWGRTNLLMITSKRTTCMCSVLVLSWSTIASHSLTFCTFNKLIRIRKSHSCLTLALLCRYLCSTPQNAGSTYWYLPSLTVTTTKARTPIAEDPTERVVYISEHSTVDLPNKNVAAPTQGVTTIPALQLEKCLGLTRALQLIDDIGKRKRLSSRNLRIRTIVRCRPVTVGYASILSWPPYDHWYRINHALRSREAIANTLATKIKTWAGLL